MHLLTHLKPEPSSNLPPGVPMRMTRRTISLLPRLGDAVAVVAVAAVVEVVVVVVEPPVVEAKPLRSRARP